MESSFEIELQEKQSNLFLYAFNKGIDIYKFIDCFMKSPLAKEIDSDFSNIQLQPINQWYEEIINTYKIDKIKLDIDIEAVIWLGYFYRKWHYITLESSLKINRFLSAKEGIQNYYNLHQLEENNAIEQIKENYNQRKNNHRKYEVKQYKNNSNFYNNNIEYFAYLAKKILFKINGNHCFKKMIYKKDINDYYFINKEKRIKLITKLINRDSTNNILDIYKSINNNDIDNKSILFIFIFSKEYELKNNIELKKEISYIRENNKFNEIYIYILGTLYKINEANELKELYVPISYKTRKSVINEIELDKAYKAIERALDNL